MKPVGIIANPASGKDIRRIAASGMVVTHQEKINTIIRMLMAMDTLGVEEVLIMPDTTHLGERVISEVQSDLKTTSVSVVELPYMLGTYKDSIRTAQQMEEMGAACIVTMGGDGTSRVVAKGSGDTPLIPVSTGTNNVFPRMVEGTLVGIAAAALATGEVASEEACGRAPLLELRDGDGELIDIALVDLAVVDARDIGARAVCDPDTIRELFLTCASPTNIGLSAIGGYLSPMLPEADHGVHISLGTDEDYEKRVTAPIAPGLLKEISVLSHRPFGTGEHIPISFFPCVVALDGEREVVVKRDSSVTVGYNPNGPYVVDLDKVLQLAAQKGLLVSDRLSL